MQHEVTLHRLYTIYGETVVSLLQIVVDYAHCKLLKMYGTHCSTLFGCFYLWQQNSGNKIPPHGWKMWFNTLKEQY